MYMLRVLLVGVGFLLAVHAATPDLILKSPPRNSRFGRNEAFAKTRPGGYGLTQADGRSFRPNVGFLRCPGSIYDYQDLQEALQQAKSLYLAGETVGYNGYPHYYGNTEGFEFSLDHPYLVFPIKYAEAYAGGPPGHSRIIISKDRLEFVGAISHRYSGYGEFQQCPISESLLRAVNRAN